MMTRQDFNVVQNVIRQRIAKNIRRETFPCQNAVEHELGELGRELADEFQRTYSNFNKAKFLRGCGL